MIDLVNISIPNAAGYALLGYLVVFLGLVMLMCVILLMGKIMHREPKAAPAAAAPEAPAPAEETPAPAEAAEATPAGEETQDPAEIVARILEMQGQPVEDLIDWLGEPESREYSSSCLVEGGQDGQLCYDGFTVYTLVQPDGTETIYDCE